MSLLPTYKEITELLKRGAMHDAQEKIMALREGALLLEEENLTLRKKVSEMEAELQRKRSFHHVRQLYYADGDAVPFCPRCWESQNKAVHLFGPVPMVNKNVEFFECHVCGYDYSAKKREPFSAELSARRLRLKV